VAKNIQNPGSALGEAIGAQMEKALNDHLRKLADRYDCHFISKGPKTSKAGKHKKLLMYDNFATSYNIDGVITNESLQPLILIECKYIRYKKHNRDKGSWVCTAHQALRKRYNSIRSSIAVLAGNWSRTSLAMLRTHDVNIFLIPFESICSLLSRHKITFNWAEKDRAQAQKSWETYCKLSSRQKYNIGKQMVSTIASELKNMVEKVLDESTPRQLEKILLEVHTSLGEVRIFEYDSIESAIDFLNDFDFDAMLDTSDAVALFEPPPQIEDEKL
jgi:hypothetical protein